MALEKQMEMFDDGGLMDEGGTVDPVSGNDVPPGSTQEEVRDDIPAQLSEGEFVFPADVVRYIGLGNLMRMRQEAKMGLKMMDEMGQMGNSEEATMPDDLPFDINDLDMEDDDEYNTPQEFAVGGMPTPNPNTGVFYNPAPTAPTTGVAAAPTQAASQQFVQPMRPQQAGVPTMPAYQPSEIPTFKGFVGDNIPGVEFEYVDYTNEAGNVIKLRKSKTTGELLDPVPEGYSYVDPEATKTKEVTTTPTTPQTTSVREEGDSGKERQRREEEMYGPGGGRLGIKGDIYGVSFDGINPLTEGRGLIGNLITGGMIPANLVDKISVNLQNPEYGKFTVTGQEYNAVKQSIDEFGANSKRTKDLMNTLRLDAKTREAQRAIAEAKKEEKRVKTSEIFKDSGFQETGGDESVDTSAKGAALEASLKGSPTPGGTGRGRQDYSGGVSKDSGNNQNQSSGEGKQDSSPDQSSGSSTGGYYDFNQGGLASKPKPKKIKKMKKGGLASKK